MWRIYAAGVCVFYLLFTLAEIGVSMIGQAMHQPEIAYLAVNSPYFTPRANLMMLDLPSNIALKIIETDASIGSQIIAGQNDQFAYFACNYPDEICSTLLWDDSGRYTLSDNTLNPSNFPTWNDDGRFVYISCEPTCDLGLWDNGTMTAITNTPTLNEMFPTWSNDGRLAFLMCDGQLCDIGLWDGNTITNLTQNPMNINAAPLWSNDGRLAFIQCDSQTFCQLLVWDGSAVHSINFIDIQGQFMRWSADGRLAYGDCLFGRCDIAIWDGTNVDNITRNNGLHDISPQWSDDGRIAFETCTTYPNCQTALWDGAEIRLLSQNPLESTLDVKWHNEWVTYGSCDSAQCDIMLWDGSTNHNLTNTSQRIESGVNWVDDDQFIFLSCDLANSLCDIMLWNGQTVIPLTSTPNIHEYGVVWLP